MPNASSTASPLEWDTLPRWTKRWLTAPRVPVRLTTLFVIPRQRRFALKGHARWVSLCSSMNFHPECRH
jgi:hypothetical protein